MSKTKQEVKELFGTGRFPKADSMSDLIDLIPDSSEISGNYLKLVDDLDAYTDAPVGEIVKYVGQTNGQYTTGWDYKKVLDSPSQYLHISVGDFYFQYNNSATIYTVANDGAVFMEQKGSPIYKLVDQKENVKWMYDSYSRNSAYLIDGSTVHAGDNVILVYANADGKAHDGAVITEIATVNGDKFTVITPNGATLTFSSVTFNTTTVFYFVNADNTECITFSPLSPVNTSEPTSQSLNMLFPNDDVYARVDWIGNISEEDTYIASSSAQSASYSWQPVNTYTIQRTPVIHIKDATTLNNNLGSTVLAETDIETNDLIIVSGLSSSTPFTYLFSNVNNTPVTKTIQGSPDFDVLFRVKTDGFQPVTFNFIFNNNN